MSEDKNKTLGEIILAGLMDKPSRIDAFNIQDHMYEDRQERNAFKTVLAKWRNGKPERIEPELIKAAGNDDGDYLCGLRGYEPVGDESFAIYFRRFREEPVRKSLVRKLNRLAKSENTDAQDFHIESLRPELEELVGLKERGRAFEPDKVLMTGAEIQTLDIHVDWVLNKLIPERALTLIYGPGGVGKTWLALAIARAVSVGAPFLGLATKQKPVFYVDRENPWPLLIERARKMDIRDVRFWHLSFAVQPPKLDAPEWEIYKSLPTGGLVIFDTCRSFHDGDENSSQDAALVMNRLKDLRERDNTIALLHHTPRSSERVSKGSTAWEDLSDQALAFHRVRRGSLAEIKEEIIAAEYDPDALYRLGTGGKTRYEPARFYATADFEAGGFILAGDPGAAVLDRLAEYIVGEGNGQNQTEIYKWARENIDGCGRKDKTFAALNRGTKEGRWRVRLGPGGSKRYEPPS